MNVHHAVRANRSHWLHLLCLANLLIVWIQQTSCGLLEPLKHLQLFSNQPASSTTNSRAFNSSVIPRPLSRIADSIYSSMLSIDTNRVKHPSITADQLLTSGRITRHAVGLTGKDHLCRDMFATPIEEAQEEVILSSFLIEKDSECIKQVAEALRKLNTRAEKEGRRVRVYMIVDALALIVAADIDLGYLWHVFKSTNNQAAAAELMQKLEIFPNILNGVHELPARLVGLPDPAEVPSLDLRLRTFHFWPAGTLHSKSMTIDGRRVIIGSQNIDAATGLELLVDMEGPVASVVRQDFYHTWRTARSIDDGHDEYGMPSSATGNTTGVRMPLLTRPTPKMTSDMIPILVAPHGWEERARLYDAMDFQNVAWATAMKMAKRRVFIQTPNINVPAIREIIADTVRRGVQVDVVASYHFEDVGEALYPDSQADGTNHLAFKQLYNTVGSNTTTIPQNFRACWYVGRHRPFNSEPDKEDWSHVKFMNIDDEVTLFGSGNQDAQSWFHSQEFNLVIDDIDFTRRVTNDLLNTQRSFNPCHTNA